MEITWAWPQARKLLLGVAEGQASGVYPYLDARVQVAKPQQQHGHCRLGTATLLLTSTVRVGSLFYRRLKPKPER